MGIFVRDIQVAGAVGDGQMRSTQLGIDCRSPLEGRVPTIDAFVFHLRSASDRLNRPETSEDRFVVRTLGLRIGKRRGHGICPLSTRLAPAAAA
jgi:hypothetical protein